MCVYTKILANSKLVPNFIQETTASSRGPGHPRIAAILVTHWECARPILFEASPTFQPWLLPQVLLLPSPNNFSS